MDFRWSHWPSIFTVLDHSAEFGNRLEAMPSKPCPILQAFLDALPKSPTSKQWDALLLYSFKDKR